MPTLPRRHDALGALRARGLIRKPEQVRDERRGSAHERGYGARWQSARAGFLQKHPLCCCCLANGAVEAATVVDHIVPHRGDMALFWDRKNWQPLGQDCHNKIKRLLEDRWERGEIDAELLNLARPLPEFFAPP